MRPYQTYRWPFLLSACYQMSQKSYLANHNFSARYPLFVEFFCRDCEHSEKPNIHFCRSRAFALLANNKIVWKRTKKKKSKKKIRLKNFGLSGLWIGNLTTIIFISEKSAVTLQDELLFHARQYGYTSCRCWAKLTVVVGSVVARKRNEIYMYVILFIMLQNAF